MIKKDGIILINKPSGLTSHDVVDFVRKKFNIRSVGHAGSLDPLAEGLLIILVGKSTRLFNYFSNFDKEYLGILKLGETTTTGDCEGKVIKIRDYRNIDLEKINELSSVFSGEIEQIPPMVSALRVKGKRLYSLARKGIIIERKSRKIKIYSIKILSVNLPFIEFYVHCSKGTYIRKLAEDMGEYLGCGAHIIKIKRLSIGHFKLEDAVNLERLSEDNILSFNHESFL